MLRTRMIRPDFFLDENVAELPHETRLLLIGLWMAADREGRLEDRPRQLRALIFPYETLEVAPLLDKLAALGHIHRYEAQGKSCIQIVNFHAMQRPHHTERASTLPQDPAAELSPLAVEINTIPARLPRPVQQPSGLVVGLVGDMVARIERLTREAEWSPWWCETLTRVQHKPGVLSEIEHALGYAESCADPDQRAAKDLGELTEPGKYLVMKATTACKRHGIRWPPFPNPPAAFLASTRTKRGTN